MISAVLSRADVQACLADAHSEFLGLGVRRLALFGSVLRNTARADSDVDVLVEFEPGQKTYDHFVALAELLERLLNHPVELVTPESLSPFLKSTILAEATDVVRAA